MNVDKSGSSLQYVEHHGSDAVVVDVAGNLNDAASATYEFAERFPLAVDKAIERSVPLLLDALRLTAINSVALRVLFLAAIKNLVGVGRGGFVMATQGMVREKIQIARFDKVIAQFDDADEALRLVTSARPAVARCESDVMLPAFEAVRSRTAALENYTAVILSERSIDDVEVRRTHSRLWGPFGPALATGRSLVLMPPPPTGDASPAQFIALPVYAFVSGTLCVRVATTYRGGVEGNGGPINRDDTLEVTAKPPEDVRASDVVDAVQASFAIYRSTAAAVAGGQGPASP